MTSSSCSHPWRSLCVPLGNSSQTLGWRGERGDPQQSGAGGGDFRAAFAKTPCPQVITGSFPTRSPHQCPCCVCTASTGPDWTPALGSARGSQRGGTGGAEQLSPTPALGTVRSAAEKCKSRITGSIKGPWKVWLTYIKDGARAGGAAGGVGITAERSKGIKYQDVQYSFASQRDS